MHSQILFVDDEPNILAAFRRQLRNTFEIETAESGQAALEWFASGNSCAVLVSDLRMPGMDGISLLSRVRGISQDTVRILLTGHADLNTAIDAVNDGHIFRFLTKPCPPDRLKEALYMALEQHRLVTAERDLLEKTLKKSVNLLTDLLSLANPDAFSRAIRARRVVGRMMESLHLAQAWKFELAATLSQTGCIALPADLLAKQASGLALSPEEERLYQSHPAIGARLLGDVPRLEEIAAMIRNQNRPYEEPQAPVSHQTKEVSLGAQLLRVALAYDQLVHSAGMDHLVAVRLLSIDENHYSPELLAALGTDEILIDTRNIKTVTAETVQTGMSLYEDLCTRDGERLASKDQEITLALLERIRLAAEETGIVEPFRVRFRVASASDEERM